MMLKLLKSSVGARSDIGLAGAFIEVSAVCYARREEAGKEAVGRP